MRGKWPNQGAPLLMVCTRSRTFLRAMLTLPRECWAAAFEAWTNWTVVQRQQPHCQQETSREIDNCTVMSARGRAQYSSHLPGEFPTELQVIRGEWSLNPTGLQSPGKRKVPGSNLGRSLGHFYRSVIPHASRSLTFKHLMSLIW